jgi:hypothetical protein
VSSSHSGEFRLHQKVHLNPLYVVMLFICQIRHNFIILLVSFFSVSKNREDSMDGVAFLSAPAISCLS